MNKRLRFGKATGRVKIPEGVIGTVICFVAVALIVSFIIPLLENSKKRLDYKAPLSGVIDLWDVSAVTVKGSKFSVIKTIISDFTKINNRVRVNLVMVSDIRSGERVRLNFEKGNRPDVMRVVMGDYEAEYPQAVRSEEYSAALMELYAPWVKPAYGEYIITDVWANASVMIVNEQLLGKLGIRFDTNEVSFESLLTLLAEVSLKGGEQYYPLDFPKDDTYSYLPFCLGENNSNYLSFLMDYLPENHSTRTALQAKEDFLSGKTAVYCGDLLLVNSLIRRASSASAFDYSIIPYPSNQGKMVFIREYGSYIFYKGDNKAFDELLCEMALYMLSPQAQRYTENLGMISCGKTELVYDMYPHLRLFNDKKLNWESFRSDEARALYAELKGYFDR